MYLETQPDKTVLSLVSQLLLHELKKDEGWLVPGIHTETTVHSCEIEKIKMLKSKKTRQYVCMFCKESLMEGIPTDIKSN